MATFAQLQTRVQKIIIDLPTTVQTEIPTLINEAVRELQRRHDFRVCEALSDVYETTAETELLAAVPTNFHKWRGRPQLTDADVSVRRLGIADSRADAEREWGSIAGGEHSISSMVDRPKVLFIGEPTDETGAASFYCRPIPDELSLYADGNYRIRVPYWKFLTELSGSSDSNWFTTNAEHALCYLAASQGFLLDWDEERAGVWAQNAANKLKEVIDLDKRQRYAAVDVLVPNGDANGPRAIQDE